MEKSRNLYKIALLVSLSCVLQIAESLFPHPFPGIRLGLANVMTLIALVNLGFSAALEVAILRVVVSSFILGTFMSPAFILSFCSALFSTFVMSLVFRLVRSIKYFRLSIVGVSVIGALAHNLMQLVLVYFILIRHQAIFMFLPWLCVGATVTGWITGIAAQRICLILTGDREAPVIPALDLSAGNTAISGSYFSGTSMMHKMRSEIKILGVILLAFILIFVNSFRIYLGLFAGLLITALFSKIPVDSFLSCFKRYGAFIFISFFFPAVFNPGSHVFYDAGFLKLTYEGLSAGANLCARIILLIGSNFLLVKTTSVSELSNGLSRVFAPLRFIGICQERAAGIISLSLAIIPALGESFKKALREADLKSFRNAIPVLSDIIAGLYLSFDLIER